MMKPIPIQLILSLLLSILMATSAGAATPDFEQDVAPILNRYCVGCHASDGAEADLALDTFAALQRGGKNGSTIDAAQPDKSLLLRRILDPELPMPPEDEEQPTKGELAILKAWLLAGAKGPARNADQRVIEFDEVAASSAAKPVTAIAFGGQGEGNIVVNDLGLCVGIEVKSKGGFLQGPANNNNPKDLAPFKFMLSNTANEFVLATVPNPVNVVGPLKLPVRYTGKDPENDLSVTYGDGQSKIRLADYRVGSGGIAVARFGEIDFFRSMSDPQAALQFKTPGKVNSMQFSSDGASLVAASGVAGLRGEVIKWDVISGKVLQRYQGHSDTVYAVDISNDGKLVATGSYDRKIIIWNAASGEQVRTLSGHNGAICDLAFSPDAKVLCSSSADATVKIWNVATGERLDTLSQPQKEQYTVDISPDGKFVVAGGEDNRIRMWRLVSIDTPQINPIVHACFAHEGAVEQLRYSASGKYIISSSSDQTVKVWSTELDLLNSYDIPVATTEALGVSPDQVIAIGTVGGKVKTMPLQTNVERDQQPVLAAGKKTRPAEADNREYDESEPNDRTLNAQPIVIPATVQGSIHGGAKRDGEPADQDVYQFKAKAGEEWIFEVRAAREKSPLDSHLAILDSMGQPVPRVQLRAVRDTYFTFRGKDSSTTGDFRLHNWEEMTLNQYLYASGEVVRLYHYPRGPDSGFNVYPNFGKRRGYFDTTPLAHALHEPAYIVEPHPVGEELPPNGLPVFTLNYENDDDSQRRLGADSRMTFVAPADGDYFVSVRDVRGQQGEDFTYSLVVRPPQPNFKCKVLDSNPKVAAGTGRKFGVEAERVDGFDGPIEIEISGLPEGFYVPGPLQIEPGHDRLWATLWAEPDAKTPDKDALEKIELFATAQIDGKSVRQSIGSLGKIEVSESPKLLVQLIPDHETEAPDDRYPVVELKAGTTTTATIRITRQDHEGRVGFGNESGAVNAPHGVYVDNIGLNGVLIVEGQDERQFFITAESWVKPVERVIFVEAGEAGKPTSNPVLLRVLPPDQPNAGEQASR